MAVYALGDLIPSIHSSAYIADEAVVIGDVTIGADSSIWPGAVLRGDFGRIEVGQATSIQDNCVIHTTAEIPTVIGNRCIVGHLAHIEGAAIGDDTLVGVGSMILAGAIIEDHCVIGGGTVILGTMRVPARALATGVPATIREGKSPIDRYVDGARRYVEMANRHAQHLRRIR